MENKNQMWVLGHKISNISISADFDLVMGETPAQVQGPPPHLHKALDEVFLVVEGEMDFIVNGEMRKVKAGESVDLPRGTIHTFGNSSSTPCKWLNMHSPKGFLSFFKEMGISADDPQAVEKSIDKSVIDKVMSTAADYDMHIQL